MLKVFRGVCPLDGEPASIEVTYGEVKKNRVLYKSYKINGYECTHKMNCANAGECPIVEKIPHSIN